MKIMFGSSFILLFSFLVRNVTLKNQADMNHQEYVADYFVYTAVLFFSTHIVSFWIDQG